MTPLATHSTNLPGSAWIIGHWYTRDGRPVSESAIRTVLQGYHHAPAKQIGPNTFQTTLDPVRYLSQHGYTSWTSYQPGSRFWQFQ